MMADDSPEKSAAVKTAEITQPDEGKVPTVAREIGGTDGPDPTRYGDWENKGRCIDF